MSEMEQRHQQYIRKEALRLGLIDLGPRAVHTTVTDTRDLRDPAALGAAIQAHRHRDRASLAPLTASEIYDRVVVRVEVPDYSHSESLVEYTVATYRQKMQDQAAKGDLAAVRVLIDKEWPLPDDLDPALAARAREMSSAADEVIDT